MAATSAHRLAGARAEDRAAWYLWRRGWRICARNWIGGGGELDLVASRWHTLLVAEVRLRSDGAALRSVGRPKLDRTLAAARALVRSHHLESYRLRIDLIAIDGRGRITRRRDILRGHPGW